MKQVSHFRHLESDISYEGDDVTSTSCEGVYRTRNRTSTHWNII